MADIKIDFENFVATVTLCRPPHNFFDARLVADLAGAYEWLDGDAGCRAVVLAADGKSFCAGADFSAAQSQGPASPSIYKEAVRLFRTRKPVVAAVHGAAIGGGLGLAVSADFRVTCAEARFSANFSRLGFHPGFGLTAALPRLVGHQAAALLLYTGRRIGGEEAHRIGLADMLVEQSAVLESARTLAGEIAGSAPMSVIAIRETLRRGMADEVERATEREFVEQDWLGRTRDFAEGVNAMSERRPPRFIGQ
ncbi:MAG: enoyl-CoA hydratase/isomerase family protein [Mesorhizobium sp.]|uniref:enoyl-CoA hydratase/isomerase family protein n=1 Tax=Mesorhizobium sp. TaxID=1871066 RepID=UPI000FE96C9D|nr:enoyl-CoA hydratase/isomerase family protein [Mesorhizobium sp.]RWI54726.1 MAG: enoyl-CoA hydratase/isomerase family protein [Mesorhizobium sp.]